MNRQYEIAIHWSDEDRAFVAEAPELPGCMAHGPTKKAARESIEEAIALWLDTAREYGDPIPKPRSTSALPG